MFSQDFKSRTTKGPDIVVDDYRNLAYGEDANLWEKLIQESKYDEESRNVASPKVLSKLNHLFDKKPMDKLFVRTKPQVIFDLPMSTISRVTPDPGEDLELSLKTSDNNKTINNYINSNINLNLTRSPSNYKKSIPLVVKQRPKTSKQQAIRPIISKVNKTVSNNSPVVRNAKSKSVIWQDQKAKQMSRSGANFQSMTYNN